MSRTEVFRTLDGRLLKWNSKAERWECPHGKVYPNCQECEVEHP